MAERPWMPVLVFWVALVIRILALVAPPEPEWKPDSGSYDRQAIELLDGEGFVDERGVPTSFRSPGYPLFMAGVYSVTGHDPGAVRLVQAVLDALTCALVYVLARRMFNPRAALAAAALTVFSLAQIYAARLILAESLVTFLVVLAVLLLHAALTRRSWSAACGAGTALGLGILVKGTLLLPTVLFGWAIWRASRAANEKPFLRWAAVMGFAGLTLLPWTVRNYAVHGRFVPVSTQAGYLMYCGNHPVDGRIFGTCEDDEILKRFSTLPEAEANAALMQETYRYVAANPGTVPRNALLKIVYFFSPIDWELLPGSGTINLTYVFALPFAVYGAWIARRSGWASAGVLATMVAGFLLTVLLTESSPRYRFPLEPLLGVFAGLGLVSIVDRFAAQRRLALGSIAGYLTISVLTFVFSDQVRVVIRGVFRQIW